MKLTEGELRRSHFSHFLGKIVTIHTNPSCIQYDTSERSIFIHHRNYGGLCEGFDEYGVWLNNAKDGTKAFFFFSSIQAIVEEQSVDESHPLVQKALEKAKKDEDRAREERMAQESYTHHQHLFEPEPVLTELSVDKLQQVLKEKKR